MSAYNNVISSILRFSETAPWQERIADFMQFYLDFCAYYLKVTPQVLQQHIDASEDAERMVFGVVFEDFLTLHFDQQTLIDAYMAKHGWKESAGSRRYANLLAMSTPQLYRVMAAVPGKSISLQALDSNEITLVEETTASHHVVVNQYLYARVFSVNRRNLFTGGVLPFSAERAAELFSLVSGDVSLPTHFGRKRQFSRAKTTLGMMAVLIWLEDYFFDNNPRASEPVAKSTEKVVYEFKVSLKDSEPSVWRRFQINADANFYELHIALQSMMGWTDSHLHEFNLIPKGKRKQVIIAIPYDEDLEDRAVLVSWQTKLSDYCQVVGQKMNYVYDFGDSWHHEIVLEAIMPAPAKGKYPRCVAGSGACPPEDCGGIAGYAHLMQVLSDPRHEEHDELSDWYAAMGKSLPFNPDAFDCKQVKLINAKKSLKNWLDHLGQ